MNHEIILGLLNSQNRDDNLLGHKIFIKTVNKAGIIEKVGKIGNPQIVDYVYFSRMWRTGDEYKSFGLYQMPIGLDHSVLMICYMQKILFVIAPHRKLNAWRKYNYPRQNVTML